MVSVVDGPSRRVGPSGVLIGRSHDCDIVAVDPTVSRRHALVRLTGDGAEVVLLGRAPITLDGTSIERTSPLADGSVLELPGCRLRIEIEQAPRPPDDHAAFLVERRRGGSFGLVHTPFVLGGDDNDDLIIKRWPAHALAFHVAGGELFVEVRTGRATRNGVDLANDSLEPLALGDALEYRKEVFTVRTPRDSQATTLGTRQLPQRVAIELLPRGGRVVFTVGELSLPVYLSDRRLDLVMALLRPPAQFAPGDFIPDDVVGPIVWPRKAVTRQEINMLISRCRRDLVDAGLAGPHLLERAPGGGGTRFLLAPGAQVVVES